MTLTPRMSEEAARGELDAARKVGQRSMPAQRPGSSRQDYETPSDFLDTVRLRFGTLTIDLAAADTSVAKAPKFFSPEEDSLSDACDWVAALHGPNAKGWLNPPFAHIEPWAAKCCETLRRIRPRIGAPERARSGIILFLTPASVGANWYARHVHGVARVFFLNGRLTFVGAKDAYPKDCMLSVFGMDPGFEVWRWRA